MEVITKEYVDSKEIGSLNIYDLFDEDIEYPDNDEIVEGVNVGVNFCYISNTYLNGFINYVDIIGGYMIRRYKVLEKDIEKSRENNNQSKEDLSWEESCKLVDKLSNGCHTCLSDSNKFDDQLILAKNSNSYWLFWNDCDCSDCCIGRLDIKLFESDEVALEYLRKTVVKFTDYYTYRSNGKMEIDESLSDTYMKFIPASSFTGWITL